jgi:hypothetical protein
MSGHTECWSVARPVIQLLSQSLSVSQSHRRVLVSPAAKHVRPQFLRPGNGSFRAINSKPMSFLNGSISFSRFLSRTFCQNQLRS